MEIGVLVITVIRAAHVGTGTGKLRNLFSPPRKKFFVKKFVCKSPDFPRFPQVQVLTILVSVFSKFLVGAQP